MMTIRKVLFPTDFSNRAERVFTFAAQLAAEYNAELHVLHVTAEKETASDPMEYLGLKPEDEHTWSDAAASGGAQVVHARMRVDSPSTGILQYAEGHDVDLIVMSTHGRKGLDHFLLGSISEEVVRLAPCPVYTIRDGEEPRRLDSIERVLVPIDFSDSSEMSVGYAREIAARSGAKLDFLHVIEEAIFPTTYGVDPVAVAVPQVIERSRESLDDLIRTTSGPEVRHESHVIIDHAVGGIVDFAESHGSDLIVIATHGLRGIQRLLIGSVTEKVVRMAPCPVLTVKTFGKNLLAAKAAGDTPGRVVR